MLLGLYQGFKEIGKMPQLIAVQTEVCSPINNSYYEKSFNQEKNSSFQDKRLRYTRDQTRDRSLNEKSGDDSAVTTMAEGIAVGSPMRKDEIIEAVEKSSGKVITVSETEIKKAYFNLHKMGIYIEPTAAAAPAGFIKDASAGNTKLNEKVVVPLTGSGLKK